MPLPIQSEAAWGTIVQESGLNSEVQDTVFSGEIGFYAAGTATEEVIGILVGTTPSDTVKWKC